MTKKNYTINEIKQILENLLKNLPVYKVILFGSYAKNEANEDSDIDLIIDTKEVLMGLSFYELISELEEALNKNIDAFEKSEIIEESKIDKEIQKTGVVIYEK